MKNVIIGLSAFVLFTGCAAKYSEGSFFKSGYTAERLSGREFIIGYKEGLFNKANDPSDRDRFVLVQAAELTLENGFTHFTYDPFQNSVKVHIYQASDAPLDAYDANKVLQFVKK